MLFLGVLRHFHDHTFAEYLIKPVLFKCIKGNKIFIGPHIHRVVNEAYPAFFMCVSCSISVIIHTIFIFIAELTISKNVLRVLNSRILKHKIRN